MASQERQQTVADGMTFEVEMKFRVDDPSALRRQLSALGFVPAPPDEQEDRYMTHPCRDLGAAGEAFRIRRHGEDVLMTYKGPRQPGPSKTREEIEIPCGTGPVALEGLSALFNRLGFGAIAAVRKRRTPHGRAEGGRAVLVLLDEVEGLGTYAEVETIARGPDDVPAAQEIVQRVAGLLGLGPDRLETRSYLRMVLEARGNLPGPA